jgi:hypothetical protein
MGWFRHDPRHEGHLVALGVSTASGIVRFRELRYPEAIPDIGVVVEAFQVGCTCGWRSPRYIAPVGARYHPYVLELHDEGTEERARAIWGRHHDEEAARPLGSLGYASEVP